MIVHYSFTDPSGAQKLAKYPVSAKKVPGGPGTPIDIIYINIDPTDNKPVVARRWWAVYGFFTILGLIALSAGGMYLTMRKDVKKLEGS